MKLDATACYAALRAHDPRFDGVFYVGVKTTGVYCRPLCPARLPARKNCEFFARAAEAERAGYRACFRCLPELAPGHAPVDARSRLVRSATAKIEAGFLNDHCIAELADAVGVTARLRKARPARTWCLRWFRAGGLRGPRTAGLGSGRDDDLRTARRSVRPQGALRPRWCREDLP